MKKVFLIVSLISVLMLAGCTKEENVGNSNLPENTNNQQEEVTNNSENEQDEISKSYLDSSIIDAYLNMINQYAAEKEENDDELMDPKFDLIYFNDDDIPELLVTRYSISYVYTFENGELKTLIDGYGFGTWGRMPFYAPRKSLVKDTAHDSEGNFSTEYFEMTTGAFEDAQVYRVNSNVITGEKTTEGTLSIEIPGEEEFLELIGSKSASDIKSELSEMKSFQ